jgi:eukaryotic-like serine/threonine-protein kinase
MVGAFQIIDRLGAGGMGEVYRALDPRLGRKVALKVLPQEFLSNQEGIARFAVEARSASALNHPNIVTIFEVGQAGSSPYLAMELIEGWTLRQLIDEGPLPVKKVLDLGTQIVSGLAKAHNAGIVHRDLKPENIMVTSDGFVKILDFGLAKQQRTPGLSGKSEPGVSLTQAGLVIGTPDYMSPEQAAGRALDFRSDQFSAGVVLYEMLTRKRLFHRATPVQTLSAIIQDEVLPLEGLTSRVPPPLRWAIERCLAKDPAERWNSTVELVRQIRQIRDKLAEFQPPAEPRAGATQVQAHTPAPATQNPPAEVTPAPLPTAKSPMPAILSTAIPLSVGSGSLAAAPTKARRVREFAFVFLLGLAFFAGGALLGHWFRGMQIDPPAPNWKGNLLVGPMTRVMSPRSSPDGKTLAFLTLVSGRSEVAVMKPSSGDWTVLTRRADAGSVYKVCWSRDGDRLFFDRVTDLPTGIFAVSPLGGIEHEVLEDAQGPEALPDGSLLVVKRDAQRNFQVHRFRPDTGDLAPVGPAVVAERGNWSLRAFPDGKTAVFWGRLAGSTDPARRVYLLDVTTGKATPFARQLPLVPPLAIGADGNSVLAFVNFGDLQQAISVSRDGQQGKLLFPVTGKPWGLDAGADGSLIVSTMDGQAELLRIPATGGVPDQVVTMAANLLTSPVELADGGFLIPNQVLGRRRLLIRAPDGQLRPFLDSAEQATPPAALVGTNQVAFLSGAVGQPPMLTVATMPEGRIVKRLEATRGIAPQSLVASPDGRTLFYVNAGALFSIDIAGGTPRKLRPANGVAVDPRPGDPALVVQVNENDGVRLFRIPFSLGSDLAILFASPLRIAPIPISGAAVGPDGKIAVTITSPDSLFRGVGVLDPVTATLERLPVVFDGDIQYPAWGKDGSLLAVGVSLRSSLWRFQPQAAPEGR